MLYCPLLVEPPAGPVAAARGIPPTVVLKLAGTRSAASFCPRNVYRLRPVATSATALRLRFLSAVRDGRNSSAERGFRNRNADRTAVKSSGPSDRSLAKISEAMPCSLADCKLTFF